MMRLIGGYPLGCGLAKVTHLMQFRKEMASINYFEQRCNLEHKFLNYLEPKRLLTHLMQRETHIPGFALVQRLFLAKMRFEKQVSVLPLDYLRPRRIILSKNAVRKKKGSGLPLVYGLAVAQRNCSGRIFVFL